MLPNFICVGAQKSGTTTLWHLLDAHPDICMARPRETHFFSDPFRFAGGLARYELHHFAHWQGERAVGEKCPEYLYLPEVPARLHAALGPDLRILICLRSPAQRAYSHYRHNVAQLREGRDFADAIAEEADALAPGIMVPPPFGYLGRGLYDAQVRRYWDAFGKDRCLVIDFTTLVCDQQSTLAQVYRFLGVTDRVVPPPIHAGRPGLDALDLRIAGTGPGAILRLDRAPDSGAKSAPVWLRAAAARLIRRGANPSRSEEATQVRNPSRALVDFTNRINGLLPLTPNLSRARELDLNRCHFAPDIARLAPDLPFHVDGWLDDAGEHSGAS